MKRFIRPIISLCTGIAAFALMFLSWVDLNGGGFIVESYSVWELINHNYKFGNMGLFNFGAIALTIFAVSLIITSILCMVKNNNLFDLVNKICFALLVLSSLVTLFGLYVIVEEFLQASNLLMISYGIGALITVAVTIVGMIVSSFVHNKE